MKILKAVNGTVAYATAKKIYKNGKYHYNIIHGTNSKRFGAYIMYLSDIDFPATEDSPEMIELTGNNYDMYAVKNFKYNRLLDNPDYNKNKLVSEQIFLNYCIYKTDKSMFKDDIVLFLDFPYNDNNEFAWRINGDVKIIGYGKYGKERNYNFSNKGIISPVLEITGDCGVHWMYNIDPIYYDNSNPKLDPLSLHNPTIYSLCYTHNAVLGKYSSGDWFKEAWRFMPGIKWCDIKEENLKKLFLDNTTAIV